MGGAIYKNNAERLEPVTKKFFELSALDINKNLVNFSQFKNSKAIIIVNVASRCSFTSTNYEQLTKLYN